MSISPNWIALDWGTTHLRGWAMSAGNTVLAEAHSDRGMGTLTPSEFPAAFAELTRDWTAAPAIACGMVGARQGWIEAAYQAVPCTPLPTSFTKAPTNAASVHIIPGLSQSSPADVMRGEETQIAGFLALNPGWDGVLCMPGTHTKWVQISAGEVVSFQTCMTGDLFAAISGHTVLKHSVVSDDWDDAAFAEALSDTLSRPEKLAARLFALRAEGLLHGLGNATAKARLSGLLIGAELAATKPYWLGQQIGIIGAGPVADAYVKALASQGAPATVADGPRVTLAGLTAAWTILKGQL
ncbi:2-dehydro-3-deoxygalactonokinase [Flavimaricola marinus]|uniref:2-keto-3-deoxy-galactonokinase n=1 Tax=Flavimaricola marinus TaxID=1819565 RepID=A0A238LCR7_9RHOB|nr:2-dehydro-3-deoxygalactonokinase [Flavimaricola marinus]SMY06710.1 2-keto-3-deoxy-galactonokinase [Flavimaricola marinus]